MPYGIIKVDTVTFTDNGVDKNISLSGLVQNPTFTGNVTATGTISGDIIRGGTTISGITVTGTTANFVSGVFTTQLSGATVIAPTGTFTSLTGTTTTGTTANFASGVFTTQVSGVTITGTTAATTTGTFISLTGTTATFTSGIIASGTAALPSLAILSDPNTGIYSPGADQLAVATNGTERLRIDSAGLVGIGTSSPSGQLEILRTSSTDPSLRLRYSSTSYYGDHLMDPNGNYVIYSPAANGVTSGNLFLRAGTEFSVSTNNAAFASPAFLITTTGKVGIGTTSPTRQLDVRSTAFFDSNGDGTGTSPSIAIGSTSVGLSYVGGGHLSFTTGSAEKARIDSSGRLLVGTTTYAGNGKLIAAGNTGGNAGTLDICWTGSRPTAANTDIGYIRWYSADNSAGNAHYASIYASSDGASSSGSDIPGRLVFSTTVDGGSSPTEAMRINSQQELLVGTATRNANGGVLQLKSGITFPATAVAASDANTLDDYEEGTWTPVVASQVGSIGSSSTSGIYTKIGRLVYVSGTITITTGGTASGVLFVSSYPFTCGSISAFGLSIETQLTGTSYGNRITASTSGGFISALAAGGIVYTNGSVYNFSLVYSA